MFISKGSTSNNWDVSFLLKEAGWSITKKKKKKKKKKQTKNQIKKKKTKKKKQQTNKKLKIKQTSALHFREINIM